MILLKRIGIFFLVVVTYLTSSSAYCEVPATGDTTAVKADMHKVFAAFGELQRYLKSDEVFLDSNNEEEIGNLVRTLGENFHNVETISGKYLKEPGFEGTLKEMSSMLQDASNRFHEGKKRYALWRLKSAAEYCASCHTRFEVKINFGGDDSQVQSLNKYERGAFYFATRQFDKAKPLLLEAVQDESLREHQLEALRKWLVISVRVNPNPQEAIREIEGIRSHARLTKPDAEEVSGWLASLRRWQNEGTSKINPIVKSENLISQGVELSDPLSGRNGAVEFLRASSILHRLIQFEPEKIADRRAEALYLLGQAYTHLDGYFVQELGPIFLEQCIREHPGTVYAARAYDLYRDKITESFTGSGGTRIPDDVELNLRELRDLANGVPQPLGRL